MLSKFPLTYITNIFIILVFLYFWWLGLLWVWHMHAGLPLMYNSLKTEFQIMRKRGLLPKPQLVWPTTWGYVGIFTAFHKEHQEGWEHGGWALVNNHSWCLGGNYIPNPGSTPATIRVNALQAMYREDESNPSTTLLLQDLSQTGGCPAHTDTRSCHTLKG